MASESFALVLIKEENIKEEVNIKEENNLHNTLARTDLLYMLNWGTQWTMVSYLKK